MALYKTSELLANAKKNNYAVGYFESWDMESLHAVANAAEMLKSPVILGFSGNFLSNPKRKIKENINEYAVLVKSVAENIKIPCSAMLNESPDLDFLIDGAKAGFNTIMYQNDNDTYEKQVEINKNLVKAAHSIGAEVEAELGSLPMSHIETGELTSGKMTDPETAAEFVRLTGIDFLAISCGNVHLLETGNADIDCGIIKSIAEKTNIPLALHGGTGISSENIRAAISAGINKINIGTAMKRVYINAYREKLSIENLDKTDPHELIGGGGERDIIIYARDTVTKKVCDYMKMFGSEKMAR